MENSSHVVKSEAKGGIESINKMSENNIELLATEYWKWGFDENTWTPFLAEARAKVTSATLKVESTQARAKEISNQTNIAKLANTLDELGDLQDFESTATEFYIQALSKDPTSQEKLRAEHTATNSSRNSSDLVIKAATKTLKMINNKMNDEIERKESDDETIWTPYAASEWSKYNIGEQDNSDMQYLSDQYSSGVYSSDEFSSND